MDHSAREKIVYHAHKDRESTSTAETYRDERFVALDCLSLVNRETGAVAF
jgi:hypothetical protein